MSRQAPAVRAAEVKKINVELFTLTYGSLVAQLVKDYEETNEINNQLEKMGYNIGIRLVEDFLARSGSAKCQDMKDTADVISKVFSLNGLNARRVFGLSTFAPLRTYFVL
eukprot:Colp12_sorted_trinity150504_noHs@15029